MLGHFTEAAEKITLGGGEELNSFLLVSGLKQFIGAASAQGDGTAQPETRERGILLFTTSKP